MVPSGHCMFAPLQAVHSYQELPPDSARLLFANSTGLECFFEECSRETAGRITDRILFEKTQSEMRTHNLWSAVVGIRKNFGRRMDRARPDLAPAISPRRIRCYENNSIATG